MGPGPVKNAEHGMPHGLIYVEDAKQKRKQFNIFNYKIKL